jgi:hypothetical protein
MKSSLHSLTLATNSFFLQPPFTELTLNWLLPGWRPFHTNLIVFSSKVDFQLTRSPQLSSWQPFCPDRVENTVSNSNSIVVEACLPRRCLTTAVVWLFVSRSLPNNASILHIIIITAIFIVIIQCPWPVSDFKRIHPPTQLCVVLFFVVLWVCSMIISLGVSVVILKVRSKQFPFCLSILSVKLNIVTWRPKYGIEEPEQTANARQRLGKHIPAATNTQATIE